MSPLANRTFAALLAVGLSGGAALAQSSATPSALSLDAAPSASVRGGYDAAQVRSRLDHARSLCEEGRWREGLREYAAIARFQREHQILPTEALWQVANLSHNAGQLQRAATALDELATAAALHGDPVVQARALLESAIIYGRMQQKERARQRLARLEPLLASPYLSAEDRALMESRIIRG